MTEPRAKNKPKKRDLRQGMKGVVMTSESFVGVSPTSKGAGPEIAAPDVKISAPGQATHE